MVEFEEAIIWLKQGKKIRCSFWHPKTYVYWHEGHLFNNYNKSITYDFMLWNYLHNDDWEEYN